MIRVCNDPSVGRPATVQVADGTFRWGHLCPPDYTPPQAPTSVIVWEGPEVIVEEVDSTGQVAIDALGYPTWRRSDKGDGGWTKHRNTEDCKRRVTYVDPAEDPAAGRAA